MSASFAIAMRRREAFKVQRRKNAFTLTATTAGAGNVTLHRMTPAAGTTLTIAWGDGSTTVVAAGDVAAKVHAYAGAGTWAIRVTNARDIVQIDLNDAQLSGLKSAQLRGNALTYFVCYSIGNATPGRFDSVDVAGWTPTTFYLFAMPAGYAGTFNSADVAGWTPTTFSLYSMPVGYTITAGGGFANFTTTTNFQVQGNGLNQATVNAILWELYQASVAPRTGVAGTINVAGTNAAPSGVYQAAAACPVTVETPSKEVAHELLNDTCAAFANHWGTVHFTA